MVQFFGGVHIWVLSRWFSGAYPICNATHGGVVKCAVGSVLCIQLMTISTFIWIVAYFYPNQPRYDAILHSFGYLSGTCPHHCPQPAGKWGAAHENAGLAVGGLYHSGGGHFALFGTGPQQEKETAGQTGHAHTLAQGTAAREPEKCFSGKIPQIGPSHYSQLSFYACAGQ